eukprot:symbB.v1.2.033883.t1/scaffold4275.1/size42075/1
MLPKRLLWMAAGRKVVFFSPQWFGSECCSKDTCLMALQGDRPFFHSCDQWKSHQDLSRICSATQNDVCACLEAGCVAQEVGAGSVACFASYQAAAGNQIFAADVRSECFKEASEQLMP